MDRALVAISILLGAAAFAAAEPPATVPAASEATASTPVPVEPTAPAAASTEPAVAPASAAAATANAETAPTIDAPIADAAAPTADSVSTPEAVPTANAELTADAAPTAGAVQVPTVDIKKVTDDTVCRKERPTGSLIGVMRCYSRSATANNADELMRRDVEEMRMRQNDQQAREAAAAMSRRRPVQ